MFDLLFVETNTSNVRISFRYGVAFDSKRRSVRLCATSHADMATWYPCARTSTSAARVVGGDCESGLFSPICLEDSDGQAGLEVSIAAREFLPDVETLRSVPSQC